MLFTVNNFFMKKLSEILDLILFSVALCFIAFCVSYSLSKSFVLSFIITAITFIVFATIYFFVLSKKSESISKENISKTELENLKKYLLTSKKCDIDDLFCKAFDEVLSFSGNIKTNGKEVFWFFDGTLSQEMFFKVARSSDKEDIAIFCIDHYDALSKDILYFDKKRFEIFDLIKTRSFLSEKGLLPKFSSTLQTKTFKLKEFFVAAFSKAKCKKYLLTSLFLAATSFFTPYKVLYLAVAILLVCFSCVIFFSKNKT